MFRLIIFLLDLVLDLRVRLCLHLFHHTSPTLDLMAMFVIATNTTIPQDYYMARSSLARSSSSDQYLQPVCLQLQ